MILEIEIETTLSSKNALRDINIVFCRAAIQNENDRQLGWTQRSLTGLPVAGLNSTARNFAQFSGQYCSRGERSTQTEKGECQRRAQRVRHSRPSYSYGYVEGSLRCRRGASNLSTACATAGTATVRRAAFTVDSVSKEGRGLCMCVNPERLASNSNGDQLQWYYLWLILVLRLGGAYITHVSKCK